MLEVEGLMVALIAVAAVRAHRDFAGSRPLTWVFAAGFVALPVATAFLYARMEARSAERTGPIVGLGGQPPPHGP